MNTEEVLKTGCVFRFGFSRKYGMFSQNITPFQSVFRQLIGQKMEFHKKMFFLLFRNLKRQEPISSIFQPEIPSNINNLKWEECGKLLFRIWLEIQQTFQRLQQEISLILTKSTPLF